MGSRIGVKSVSLVLASAVLVALIAGCSAKEETASNEPSRDVAGGVAIAPDSYNKDSGAVSQEAPMPEVGSLGAGTPAPEADRMVIRSNTLRLEVKSTPDAVGAIRALAEKHSAIITDLQVATDTGDWLYRYDESGYAVGDGAALRGWVTVRVPAESLAAFTDGVVALGTVKYQSEDTEDVTQQHVDLSARLENLRAEEVRLRGFFDAAANVEEMLAIESELNRIRSEIESLDAQVKYLERQAAMATVTVELTEEQPVVRPDGESWGFREAITDGIRGAANVLTVAITVVLATAPLWASGLIIFFVVRAIIRMRRAKRSAAATHNDA